MVSLSFYCNSSFHSSCMKGTLIRANVIPVQKICPTTDDSDKSISVALFFVYSVALGRMFKPLYLCGDRSREKSVFVLHLVVKNG